jgi:hypothetical protein
MSGITRFSVTPANAALKFSWGVGSSITTTNIASIKIILTDDAIPGTQASGIQVMDVTPVTSVNGEGNLVVVDNYTWSNLTNGTRYIASLKISTVDANGVITDYIENTLTGLKVPGTVPIKPVFTAYAIANGIKFRLVNSSNQASYTPRSVSDGFYGIKKVNVFYRDKGSTNFANAVSLSVLTNDLSPDSTDEDIRNADVQYDKEFLIGSLADDADALTTDKDYELAISVSNALGDSLLSLSVGIKTGSTVGSVDPVAVATLEYNRYNKVSATAEVINASTATILFNQATNTVNLKNEKFPVTGYHIYRQDVSSNGTSLIPFTKSNVGSITSLDASGNAIGGQGQYNYGSKPYNLILLDGSFNDQYTFNFTDANVVTGKYYSYTIRGVNAKGEGSEGAGSICRIASRALAPIVVAEPSNNMIKLNITNQSLNGYPMADVSSNFNYFVDVSGITNRAITKDASGNVTLTNGQFNTIVNGGLDRVTVAAITKNPIMSTTGQTQQQEYDGLKTVLNVRPYNNPLAPSGLSLTQIQNGLPISGGCIAQWDVFSDASRNGNLGAITYNVYVGGVLVNGSVPLQNPGYQITGLTNGVAYNVTVAAVIFNSDLSANVIGLQSSPQSFTPFSLPGSATAVDLSNVSSSLTSLSGLWAAPSNVALYGLGSSAIRYKYQLTDMSSGELVTESSGSSPVVFNSLVAGTLYKLDVYSGVIFNSIVYYNTVPVTVYKTLFTLPAAPINLSIYPLDGQLRCTWDPSASNGVTMTTYDIYINNGTANGIPKRVASTSYNMEYFIAATDGSNNPLVNGREYKVQLGAIGTVKSSVTATVDVSGVLTSPAASGTPNVGPASPVIDEYLAGESKATLKWSPIPNVSGYIVFQDDNVTADSSDTAATAATGKITIGSDVVTFEKTANLIKGREYNFKVISYTDVSGLRIYSPDSAVIPIVPYAAPDPVENLDFTIGSQTITLTWGAPLNSGGVGLNGNGTLKYQVLITDQSSVTIVDQLNLNAPGFSQSGSFINNKAYVVNVFAYYTGNNLTIYKSTVARIQTVIPNPPPQQISNLTAVAGNHSVKLSWNIPDDGYLYTRTKIAIWKSTNRGKYKLYRISDPTNTSFEDKVIIASRLPDNTSDSTIAGLSTISNNTNITLSDVVNGFEYKYKVTSFFDRTTEGAQLPTPVETGYVVPSGKPIVDSIAYNQFSGQYVATVSANGGKLKDWLFVGIDISGTNTPVFTGSIPSTASGSGNRDVSNEIAGLNTFEISISSTKFPNYLFVIGNDSGIDIDVGTAINDTA